MNTIYSIIMLVIIGIVAVILHNVYLVKWRRISDTCEHSAVFRIINANGFIYVFSKHRGKSLQLEYIIGTTVVLSKIINIPKQYSTPYEFLESSDIDSYLHDLLYIAERRVMGNRFYQLYKTDNNFMEYVKTSKLQFHSLSAHDYKTLNLF